MFIQRLILVPAVCKIGTPSLLRLSLAKFPNSLFRNLKPRFASSTTPRTIPSKTNGKKLFPERFLVYHAGTGRIVFQATLKVTTIFLATFFIVALAPAYLKAPDTPVWFSGAIVVAGLVPMAVVMYISGPFVNFVHLRLPMYARLSREMLMRYSKNLPKDAEIDITTMNFVGKPRVARMNATDLYAVKERSGLVNFARDTTAVNAKRRWWMGKAVRQFGVHPGRSRLAGEEAWRNIEAAIMKRSRKGGKAKLEGKSLR